MIRCLGRTILVLVSMGAAMAAGLALLRRAVPSVGEPESDEVHLAAIGEARSLESKATAFRGGSTLTVMGATRLDLRQALLSPEGARLEVRAAMGAVKILVPDSWLVRSEIQNVNSNVENRTAHAAEAVDAPAPDLVLSGTATASAVAVANKTAEAAEAAAEAGPAPAPEGAPA